MPERRPSIVNQPIPLRAAELHRRRRARRRLRRWLIAGMIGIACVAATIVAPPVPRLVWNASASAPVGLYHVTSGTTPARGDMVVARIPERVRMLAARRHYLPANVPLVKRVAGVEGDHVCAIGPGIFVNGAQVAERRSRDGRGRPMPWWRGCRRLAQRELFLLMDTAPASFDGRYFGPSSADDLVGRAHLLWAR